MSDPTVLAYGDDPLQQFNLYDHPSGAPAVLFIHGGGWQRGSKDRMTLALKHHLDRLVPRYAAFSMNYRFSPGTLFPGQVDDTHAMLDWIVAHADEHKVDPRTLVFAESSGAQMGALAAVARRHPNVRAFIGFAGVYDMTVEDETTALGQLIATNLGCDPHECVKLARAASPRFNVERPRPALLVHGTADPVVGTYQSVLFSVALAQRQSQVKFLPGGGHTGPAFMTPDVEAAVDAFLARVLPA